MDSLSIAIGHGGGVNKYPAKSHAQRVGRATGLTHGSIVLAGEKQEMYSNSDQPRHWRQDRYFYYVTGCNEPNCYVTYDLEKDHLTLWLPPVGSLREVFYMGRGSTVEEAMEKYDIDEAKYLPESKEGYVGFEDALKRFRDQAAAGSCFYYQSKLDVPQPWNDTVCKPAHLHTALDNCRAVKDQDEIALIKKANDVSSQAHLKILQSLRNITTEAQAEGLFMFYCIAAGAKEQAYGPIMGSGPNAATLHYQANNEAFGNRQVLLVDASCEWELYAADITRTIPLNPKKPGYWPSSEAEALYKAVEKIQEEAINMLKPGVKFNDVHWHAAHMAIDALLELGILKGDHMDIFHSGIYAAFAPHGLGHMIGLEVHDVKSVRPSEDPQDVAGAYAAYVARTNSKYAAKPGFSEAKHFHMDLQILRAPNTLESPPLEAGNVVTIEPGLYFNELILRAVLSDPEQRKHIDAEVLKRYMAVGGVRIEDDILITKSGYENLTKALKGEEMLKAIRGAA